MTAKTLSEKAYTAWKVTKLMFWTGVVCFTAGHLEATYLTGNHRKRLRIRAANTTFRPRYSDSYFIFKYHRKVVWVKQMFAWVPFRYVY